MEMVRNLVRDDTEKVTRPEGNTAAKALRRLRKERPDLHARVLAEELSPHAAMHEAGFRRRTLTVSDRCRQRKRRKR